MANFRRGHARDPPGNMHSPVFCLLSAREWGGACISWRSGRGDASPITGVLPFLSFLSLTLSKGIFTSNLLSKIVGLISRFFEIGFFQKMEKYWAMPLNMILFCQDFSDMVTLQEVNTTYGNVFEKEELSVKAVYLNSMKSNKNWYWHPLKYK